MSQANTGLTIYRRHSASCKVHDNKRMSSRAKRMYMDCDCQLWVEGRTMKGGIVPRQSIGSRDLAEAKAIVMARIEEAANDEFRGPKLSDCIEKYLASREYELRVKTTKQIKLLLDRFQAYCNSIGIYYIQEITVDHLETFVVEGLPPKVTNTSMAIYVSKLRTFLAHAFRRGWITVSMRDKIVPYKSVFVQKKPYTKAEVTLILDEALRLTHGRNGFAAHPKTFRLVLELMLETGLRVGDAVQFDPTKLVKGERLWIYEFAQQKHKKMDKPKLTEVYLKDGLKKAIDECHWLSPTRPFQLNKRNKPDPIAVNERMYTIGKRCGVADCRPHRLRDTFAVNKLLAGMAMEDVSKLLGHSSTKVTELYYAHWTQERKARLEQLFADLKED